MIQPYLPLYSNNHEEKWPGGVGGQSREQDGGKMRGVNREGLSERKRREALNLPSRVQRGRKYPRKRICVCVRERGGCQSPYARVCM